MKSGEKDQSRKTEATVNFGKATKYPRRKRRNGGRYSNQNLDRASFDPQDWDDLDEILGNFGDWGDH